MTDREPPFFFQKPADAAAVCTSKSCVVPYPPMTASLHHEAELVVAIGGKGGGGLRIDEETALDHDVFGYGIGCDLTRRDLQATAKQLSRPWSAAKVSELLHLLEILITPLLTNMLCGSHPLTKDRSNDQTLGV